MNYKKNIVVLMYNFPPLGAGRGIAWTFFAEKFSEDYNVDIITIAASKNDPMYNESKNKMISENYYVHRTYAGKLYEKMYKQKIYSEQISNDLNMKKKLFKLLTPIYKNVIREFIFPDRMIFWNKYAYKKFKEIKKTKNIDLIISVGFPFSTHLLGKKLKKTFGGKLILDYGDPWSFNPSNETTPSWRRKIDYVIEKSVINKADYITVTTTNTEIKFKEYFKLKNNIGVIPQGVDSKKYSKKIEDIKNNKAKNKKIKMFYSGIFYEDIRNPKEFFKAISLLTTKDLNGISLDIVIAGKMENYVFDMVNELKFEKDINIKFLGNIPLENVIEYQVTCDYLLYFGNKGELQVPGKLYEYIVARRPIFAIAPVYDEACKIIDDLKRGIIVEDNRMKIKEEIKNMIAILKNEEKYFNLAEVNCYDWNVISNKYKQIIDNILRGE